MVKKAQLNQAIVGIILALIILSILIFISYRYIAGGSEQAGALGQCTGQGGRCDTDCSPGERGFPLGGCSEGETCCISTSLGS